LVPGPVFATTARRRSSSSRTPSASSSNRLLLLVDPGLGFVASLGKQGPGGIPELLDDVVDVDGVLGVGQILGAESREVVVAIGDPLHHASAR